MAEMKKASRGIVLSLTNPAGQGLVEYSIILLLVAVVMIAVLYSFGSTVNSGLYEPINSAVTGAGK